MALCAQLGLYANRTRTSRMHTCSSLFSREDQCTELSQQTTVTAHSPKACLGCQPGEHERTGHQSSTGS